jgi:drug/metabolite transporter (DMT)-like permease
MNRVIRKTMGPIEWAMLLALSLVWAGSYLFNAVALQGFGPLTIVALRVGLAAVTLWLIVMAMGYPVPRDPALWLSFLAMGVFNNAIPFTLIVWSQQHIAAGLASILNAATPLLTVLVAHAFLADEKMSANRLAGVTVGLAGVVLMVGIDALGELGLHFWAQMAALAASLCYACASVFGRRFSGIPPMITAAGQVTGSSLVLTPLALALDRPWLSQPPPEAWSAVIGLAVPCTALAYFLYFEILRRSGATNIMLVTLLIPPGAIGLGMLFLEESLSPMAVAGLLAIGAGLVLIDGRLIRFLTSSRSRSSSWTGS